MWQTSVRTWLLHASAALTADVVAETAAAASAAAENRKDSS